MIRTDEVVGLAAVFGAQPLAPVAGDVVECADHAARVPDDQHRVIAHLHRSMIFVVGQFAGRHGEQPLAVV